MGFADALARAVANLGGSQRTALDLPAVGVPPDGSGLLRHDRCDKPHHSEEIQRSQSHLTYLIADRLDCAPTKCNEAFVGGYRKAIQSLLYFTLYSNIIATDI
jgi:hypothetical protein